MNACGRRPPERIEMPPMATPPPPARAMRGDSAPASAGVFSSMKQRPFNFFAARPLEQLTLRPAGDVATGVNMIIHADMSTGKQLVELREEYGEEVLFSNWLPQPELQLALRVDAPAAPARNESERDVEAFLRAVYLCQE